MARHAEYKQTNQTIELTTDEMDRVSGGFKFELTDVKITSNSLSSHDTPVPAN
jgi:hypothetical protein